jgi:hypothetical protein
MAFGVDQVAAELLQSPSPVVACNGYLAVVNPFSGAVVGELYTMLAMGSRSQLATWPRQQALANIVNVAPAAEIDGVGAGGGGGGGAAGGARAEELVASPTSVGVGTARHTFEVSIRATTDLSIPGEETLSGEADCYVQYFFPETSASAAAVLTGSAQEHYGLATHQHHSHARLLCASTLVCRALPRSFT